MVTESNPWRLNPVTCLLTLASESSTPVVVVVVVSLRNCTLSLLAFVHSHACSATVRSTWLNPTASAFVWRSLLFQPSTDWTSPLPTKP